MTGKYTPRHAAEPDPDATFKNALAAARATFWQTLAGSAAFTVPIGQATTWGDIGDQAAALAIAAVLAIGTAGLAAAQSFARWRGGTPPDVS